MAHVQGQNRADGEAEVTETAFGRLLYTDCSPGTGRGAGGGFQVQAQSSGVDPQQATFAVGWLLYEAQGAWVAAGRPAEEFPLGFAHTCAEGYGTSQSRYLGKEAVGGRMGNHLADCLLTRDPELYGTIRPAQLWRSPLWRTEAWETHDCPDFDGDLELGPLDLETVTDWVRARAERGPLLARLLSVLEDPKGQRVVIVSADADEAMRWIAAATLLLPQRQALEVSFKVFSGTPLRTQQRVVAAPPGANPGLRPGAGLGIFVLDTATGRADDAAVNERAQFLVGKFAADEDPYDIVDAIDLAYELGRGAWPQEVAELHAAWVLTCPGARDTDPDWLFRWLRQASKEQLHKYGPAITEALLAGNAPIDLLRGLDAWAGSHEPEIDHAAIRTRLLHAEITDAIAGQAAPATTLPDVRFSDRARRDAKSALISALLRSADSKIDLAEADLMLRLARRHAISLEPPSAPVERFVMDFVWAWLHSSEPLDPQDWALREHIVAAAQTELRELYRHGPSAPFVLQIISRFLVYFPDLRDPADPLYWHKQAMEIRRAAGKQKNERLRHLLDDIAKWRKTNPGQADRAEQDLQQALLDWNAVTEGIAVVISAEIPESHVRDEVKDRARAWSTDKASKPDADFLRLVRILDSRSPFPSGSRLGELVDSDKRVDRFLMIAGDKANRPAAAGALYDAEGAVVAIRADEVLEAIAADEILAAMVFAGLPKRRQAIQALMEKLEQSTVQLQTFHERVAFAVWCVCVLAHPDLSSKRRRGLEGIIGELHRTISGGNDGTKESRRWIEEVRRSLPDGDQVDAWNSLAQRLRGI